MSAEAAARAGDQIAHGFGLAAMVAGAVAGAIAGVAIVAAVAATGGAAAVIIAGAVAGGGLAMGQLMSGASTVFNLPEPTTGAIPPVFGSQNVKTNSKNAVRAVLDSAMACSGLPLNHYPITVFTPPVAEGSSTVYINNKPAARLKSKLMCGAHIKSGSENVVIGGPTEAALFVLDLESWFRSGLQILGLAALIGAAALAAVAAGSIIGGILAIGKLAAIAVGSMAVFELIGQWGDTLGPGYGDLFQGIAGVLMLGLSVRGARGLNRGKTGSGRSQQPRNGNRSGPRGRKPAPRCRACALG